LLAFKHGGRRELADFFAQALHERIGPSEPGCEPPLLVPVPLHCWRHLARGYDQAYLLARALAAVRGWECARLLKRVRATRPQGSALALSRGANVRAAFELRHGWGRAPKVRLARRTVWLVDDVLTSGATADECARCLLKAGAARVEVVVVARA
jgi:ComF family protein